MWGNAMMIIPVYEMVGVFCAVMKIIFLVSQHTGKFILETKDVLVFFYVTIIGFFRLFLG